jgi:hypothetical protein
MAPKPKPCAQIMGVVVGQASQVDRPQATGDSWRSAILVYRKNSNGSLIWIGEVESVRAAHNFIKLHAKQSSDEFSIRTRDSLDLTHLRADQNS